MQLFKNGTTEIRKAGVAFLAIKPLIKDLAARGKLGFSRVFLSF